MTAQPHSNTRSNESGNVFVIVFMGVVLFAALMFTFSRGTRQGGENISKKQAEIEAMAVVDYAQKMERGVQKLLIRNCSENDISFENETVLNYTNMDSPDDGSCHIFKPAGASLTWMPPSTHLNSGTSAFSQWTFDGRLILAGQGDDAQAELKLVIEVKKPICDEINRIVLGTVPSLDFTADTGLWAEPFQGTYLNSGLVCHTGSSMAWCQGKPSFCGKFVRGHNSGGPDPTYAYIHTLAVR